MTDPTLTPLEPITMLPASTEQAPHILVIDDQQAIRELIEEVLADHHYRVSQASDLRQAEELLDTEAYDAVIVDIFLSAQESGLTLLPRIRARQPLTPAIVISGMANMDHVIEALKAGAYDMLCKPFNIIDVLNVVARAVDKKRMAEENEHLVIALRHERDLLEERVLEATSDLNEKVQTLRLLNEQLATIFEMSQMPTDDGSTAAVLQHIFDLLHRIIDFEDAFCVVYDIRAQDISLTYGGGEPLTELSQNLTTLFRRQGPALRELAESRPHLPVEDLTAAIRRLYPGEWPTDVTLLPLYVHQTLLGVVGLSHKRRSTHLSQADERILAMAISHFLAAIEQRSFIARTGQLAGLGELISEIAHDLRHPMTALRGASRILLDGWRDETRRTRCLDEIQNNLSRMESLVSELVNFYNPKEMNMVPVDVHALLNRALEASQFLLEQKQIEVVCQYDGDTLPILGLSRNLIEAFINLISNACQAMEPGGRLTIETTAHLPADHHDRLRQTGRQPAAFIMIKIADTGCGIPDELKDYVFRRFFTTRPEGHGLGLSAVQRVVKKNLGHLHWESQVGRGTTFYLYLPKA